MISLNKKVTGGIFLQSLFFAQYFVTRLAEQRAEVYQ